MTTPGNRLQSIDTLRGTAALAVMVYHSLIYSERMPLNVKWFAVMHAVLGYGYLGVPLFFVISGFCIHLSWSKTYARTGKPAFDFKAFWKRRIRRLYPPYFVVLVISMSLVVAAFALHKNVPLVNLYPDPKLKWMGLDFIAHVFMVHGLIPLFDKAGGNPPFWTLAREEYYYLLYFVLLLWRKKSPSWVIGSGVFLLGIILHQTILWFVPNESQRFWLAESTTFSLWIQWVLGMLAAEAYCGLFRMPLCFRNVWFCPIWAAIAILSDSHFALLSDFLWGITFFTLLNGLVAREQTGNWTRGKIGAWLAGVGVFSYSLYLIHNPARAVTKQLLGRLAETDNAWLYLLNMIIISVVGYWSGKILFRLVESHFLNKQTRHDQPEPVKTESIVVMGASGT